MNDILTAPADNFSLFSFRDNFAEVGRIFDKDGKKVFEGDMDAAAKLLVDGIAKGRATLDVVFAGDLDESALMFENKVNALLRETQGTQQ